MSRPSSVGLLEALKKINDPIDGAAKSNSLLVVPQLRNGGGMGSLVGLGTSSGLTRQHHIAGKAWVGARRS
ncbi:hypothetical protein NPX13_g8761 [Xylaria arbuscula]|uniref:Uncharacterized protein n=1 Tax=Xylaria arbuscula TaxID=114810 RepID=A0A9W8N859_9PEZI|nr:hypothetical protein NPX13_g8761 [Xylaria arbuscula]